MSYIFKDLIYFHCLIVCVPINYEKTGPQKEHSSASYDKLSREEDLQKEGNLQRKQELFFIWQMALLPPSELCCESDITFSKMSSWWELDTGETNFLSSESL